MLKVLSLILLSMLLMRTSALEALTPKSQNYSSLSYAQKKEYVIQVMRLMADVEARYKHELRKQGFKQKAFKKYTQLMQSLENLILSSAHAASNSWNNSAATFGRLINNNNHNQCIYAGWVSRVVGGFCTHPTRLPAHSAEARAYGRGSNCPGPNQITCNPLVYGYKKSSTETLFCVEAGAVNNHAENSSLNCLEAATREFENSETDSKEERLAYLIGALNDNPEVLANVYKFIYQTCICDVGPGAMNQEYQARVRPHRTCYGLMQMMANTTCEVASPAIDVSIFTALKNSLAFTPTTDKSAWDESYAQFVQTIARGSDNAAQYREMCPSDPAVPNLQVEGTGPGGPAGPAQTPPGTPDETPDGPTGGGSPQLPGPATEINNTAQACQATCIPNPVAATTAASTSAPATGDPVTSVATAAPVVVPTYTCTYTRSAVTPAAAEEDGSAEGEADAEDATPAAPTTPAELIPEDAAEKNAVPKPNSGLTDSPSIKFTGIEERLSCSRTFTPGTNTPGPAVPEPEPKLVLTTVDPTPTTQPLQVTINEDKTKVPTGYTLSWLRKPSTPISGKVMLYPAPKERANYSVCAILTKDSDHSKTYRECQTVTALPNTSVAPPPGYAPTTILQGIR